MLNAFLPWIEADPSRYHHVALAVTGLMVGVLGARGWVAFRDAAGPTPVPKATERWLEAALVVLVGATLLAWRWPLMLVPFELNADESQQIAGGITLLTDPVFWRGVDGATAGPLNFYLFVPLPALGLPLTYFSARLLALGLVAGLLLGCRYAIGRVSSSLVGWLAILPGLAFFSGVMDWGFVHVSSEHVPLFLMGLSIAALAYVRPPSPTADELSWRWAALAGLATGALPWAKLQGGPWMVVPTLALVLWTWRLRASTTARRAWLAYGLGLVTPTALCVAAMLVVGELNTAWTSYFVSSWHYTQVNQPWSEIFASLEEQIGRFGMASALVKVTAGWVLTAAIVGTVRRRFYAPLWVVALLALAVGALVALAPRRGFAHYLLFLAPGLILLGGAAVHELLAAAGRSRGRLLGVLVLLPLSVLIVFRDRAHLVPFALDRRPLTLETGPTSELGRAVAAIAQPGDRLVVWGWQAQLHIETGLPQGTRDAHSQRQIEPGAMRPYFRDRYLQDLHRVRPRVFVDAVQPGAFAYTDRFNHGHESWRELQRHVQEHYRLHAEIGAARLYLRRD